MPVPRMQSPCARRVLDRRREHHARMGVGPFLLRRNRIYFEGCRRYPRKQAEKDTPTVWVCLFSSPVLSINAEYGRCILHIAERNGKVAQLLSVQARKRDTLKCVLFACFRALPGCAGQALKEVI